MNGRFLCPLKISLCLLAFVLTLPLRGADTPTVETNDPPAAEAEGEAIPKETAGSEAAMRAYLQLQEQMHGAVLALQQNRAEAQSLAQRNSENLSERLRLIEQSLDLRRQQELDAVHSSNRFVLTLAVIFAIAGFLSMIVAGWFQLRAMNRIAEMAATLPSAHLLGHSSLPGALGAGERQLIAENPAEQASARLRAVLDRLEKRVRELEQTAETHRGQESASSESAPGSASNGTNSSRVDHLTLLLGKGQALLNLNQPEKALACFDRALVQDPNNTEALVKKGTALERLKRLEEAIECYDHAIQRNQAMTLAYLYKGGVFNQMERFDEALECYEQALRAEQKAGLA